MVIDKSKTWWTSDSASDIETYLREFTADGYPAADAIQAVCAGCGCREFNLRLDDEEGVAERTCSEYGTVFVMLDSADYLEDAELEDAACPCGNETFNVAVGFSRDDGEVRWIYLGLRCTKDGILGCYADWKIDYSPSIQLLGEV